MDVDVRAKEAKERIATLTIAISVRSIPRILSSLLNSRLTIQQLKVLTSVVVSDGATASTLVAQFGVSMATMSKLLDRLSEQGLIERIPDAKDARIRHIEATPLGQAAVSEVMGARPELGDAVLAGLNLEELEGLELGLRAISRELQLNAGDD